MRRRRVATDGAGLFLAFVSGAAFVASAVLPWGLLAWDGQDLSLTAALFQENLPSIAAVGGSLIALLSLLRVPEAASIAGYCAGAALMFTIYTVVQLKQAYDQLTDLAGLFGFSGVAQEATSSITSLLEPGVGLIAWGVAIIFGLLAARQ